MQQYNYRTNPITIAILIIITKETIEKFSVQYLKPKTIITLEKQLMNVKIIHVIKVALSINIY